MARLRLATIACCFVVMCLIPIPAARDRSAAAAGLPVITDAGLRVVNNHIVDDGRNVTLHGVNRSGTEYSCIHGLGIFDGPDSASSVAAIARWAVNIVRIPLNEDCWLGINGVRRGLGGNAYRTAIVDYVRLLHRYGMFAELSLIWAAPGTAQATYQDGAPDEDHSPAMWESLASTFKHDPDVIRAPWGETYVSAGCFLHGCDDEASFGTGPWDGDSTCGTGCYHYTTAGMQQAVDVMRSAGYEGIIAIPGTDDGNNLSDWLSDEPHDPAHQLIAEAHVYGGNACATPSCFDTNYAPVARRVPLLLGEIGESYSNSDCGDSTVSAIMNWADRHSVGYEAWAWDAWGNCGALIRNYGGEPNSAYGEAVRQHYLRHRPRRYL